MRRRILKKEESRLWGLGCLVLVGFKEGGRLIGPLVLVFGSCGLWDREVCMDARRTPDRKRLTSQRSEV